MSARWTEYTPSFDFVARQEGIPLPKAIDLVGDAVYRGIASGEMAFNEAFAFSVEKEWNRKGRPSYRVARPLAEALADTDLDVDGAFLRFPHAAFGLELPPGFDLRSRKGGRLLGMVVGAARDVKLLGTDGYGSRGVQIEAPDGEGVWRLIVMQEWEGDYEPVTCLITLAPGVTVEARLRDAIEGLNHDASITDIPTTRKMIALALGAALFAIGSNRFVRPIGSGQRPKRSGRKAANRPPEPRRWSLGADIQLPRGRSAATSTTDIGAADGGEGRELRFAHIRQGHLRLTPTGPRADQSFVLRYIAPTVVRPDLPLAPRATRHAMAEPEPAPEVTT